MNLNWKEVSIKGRKFDGVLETEGDKVHRYLCLLKRLYQAANIDSSGYNSNAIMQDCELAVVSSRLFSSIHNVGDECRNRFILMTWETLEAGKTCRQARDGINEFHQDGNSKAVSGVKMATFSDTLGTLITFSDNVILTPGDNYGVPIDSDLVYQASPNQILLIDQSIDNAVFHAPPTPSEADDGVKRFFGRFSLFPN